MATVYFISRILSEAPAGNENRTVMLERAGVGREKILLKEIPAVGLGLLMEGDFACIAKRKLKKANSDPVAKAQILRNNLYRGILINRYRPPEDTQVDYVKELFSYHVNVGHGNCSILTIKDLNNRLRIWMIDCSNFDWLNKKSYQGNLDACIQHIRNRYDLDGFQIDKFFLTHLHHDHYSGIPYLLNSHYFHAGTEFWVNLHYSWSSPILNSIIGRIVGLGSPVVEPVTLNSSGSINLWHPDQTIARTATSRYRTPAVRIVPHVNDSSVVFNFKFGDTAIVFPGDIETTGWRHVTRCYPNLDSAQYYCVSHHGSDNGHQRTCHHGRVIKNASQCRADLNRAILMGRDGAYRGVYHSNVIRDWGNTLIMSEGLAGKPPCQFLEIDLIKNMAVHH